MLKSSLDEASKHGAFVQQINLIDYKILPHSGELKKSSRVYKDDMSKLVDLVLSFLQKKFNEEESLA